MTLHEKGFRYAVLGMLVNLGLSIVKIATGVVGHSYALVADGVESLADVVSSLVVMGGLKVSARPPDANHPFGHGKAEPIAGMVVAGLLILAALWIGWNSIHEIRHPHQAPAGYTLAVLAVVILIKEALSRRVMKVAEDLGSTAVRGDGWHHRSDALTSLAAFIGISVALTGGEAYSSADDWAALLACGVMIYNGSRLLRLAVDDLMDRAVPLEQHAAIRGLASGVDGVVGIEKCRIRRTGLGLSMDIHVIVDGSATVRRGHAIGHAVKDCLMASTHRITDVTVHVEPDDSPRGTE